MDNLTKEERSKLMSRVRSKGTGPERIVRSAVHRMGFRYRLHSADLPGCPYLVFPARTKVIVFNECVNGCFWHRHRCRAGLNRPESNREYWDAKLNRNKKRDASSQARLNRMGWRVLSVWECRLRQPDLLASRLKSFLEDR
jgi:DNA mismatch endonuclease (patch repair protein)